MMKTSFISAIALCSVLCSGFVVPTASVQADSESLHTSALEQRVAARRAARWLEQREESYEQSQAYLRRQARLRARQEHEEQFAPQPTTTTVAIGNTTDYTDILERTEERRQERLEDEPTSYHMEIITATNAERRKHGLLPLTYNRLLEQSAQAHADDMFDRDYFSHENLEGKRSGDRIKDIGYGVVDQNTCNCRYQIFLGENIAKGQTSVAQVIREWMASPSHRDAILSPDYKEIGVGIVGNIWVQNFGGVNITPLQ